MLQEYLNYFVRAMERSCGLLQTHAREMYAHRRMGGVEFIFWALWPSAANRVDCSALYFRFGSCDKETK